MSYFAGGGDGWDMDAYNRHEVVKQANELEALRTRLRYSMALLKRAGDALDIEQSQKVRALRFQILQFLENSR